MDEHSHYQKAMTSFPYRINRFHFPQECLHTQNMSAYNDYLCLISGMRRVSFVIHPT